MKKTLIAIFFIFAISLPIQANNFDTAKTLIEAKKFADSLPLLESIHENEPDNIEALYYLALNHYLTGNYELTIKHGVQAYTRDHEMADEVRAYANDQNFGERAKIGLFRKIRLAKQIRNELYLVLQDEPDNINAHYALGYYYILTPYILSGSIKRSLYHIEQVAKADTQRAYPIYSSYYRKTKKSDELYRVLNQWHTEYPDDWFCIVELARYEQDNKNTGRAYELLSQWVDKKPGDAKAIYQIGRLAATTGKYLDEGKNSLSNYLNLPHETNNPEYKWAHYRLAMIYQHMKNVAKAKDHINKALTIDPENKEFIKLNKKL